MEYSLQMVFLCESGEKSSITISEVKPGLTNTDVIALMDTIISSNIFETSKGALISKYSAQVVQREVTKWVLNSKKALEFEPMPFCIYKIDILFLSLIKFTLNI